MARSHGGRRRFSIGIPAVQFLCSSEISRVSIYCQHEQHPGWEERAYLTSFLAHIYLLNDSIEALVGPCSEGRSRFATIVRNGPELGIRLALSEG
eukprot:6250863-Prymnesium_polylepis.1